MNQPLQNFYSNANAKHNSEHYDPLQVLLVTLWACTSILTQLVQGICTA